MTGAALGPTLDDLDPSKRCLDTSVTITQEQYLSKKVETTPHFDLPDDSTYRISPESAVNWGISSTHTAWRSSQEKLNLFSLCEALTVAVVHP